MWKKIPIWVYVIIILGIIIGGSYYTSTQLPSRTVDNFSGTGFGG